MAEHVHHHIEHHDATEHANAALLTVLLMILLFLFAFGILAYARGWEMPWERYRNTSTLQMEGGLSLPLPGDGNNAPPSY